MISTHGAVFLTDASDFSENGISGQPLNKCGKAFKKITNLSRALYF
jgi:hypothetical protein